MTRRARPRIVGLALTCLLAGIPIAHALEIAQEPPAPKEDASTERTLRVYQPEDVVNLDWTRSTSEVDSPILNNLHEGLLSVSAKGTVAPALATSWKISADGKTYRFAIRPNVKWSDGKPLTSQHFVDGFRRLLSPFTASPYSYLLFDVKGAQDFFKGKIQDFSAVGIRAPDPLTVEVELASPIDNWLKVLTLRATYPIREDVIRQFGTLWTKPGNMVNIGPYVLQSHVADKSVVLRRNPLYYRATGNVQRIEYLIRTEDEAQKLFNEGKLDLILKVSESMREDFRGSHLLHWFRPLRTKRLSFNLKQFPISMKAARLAIAKVIDRDSLAQALGLGFQPGRTLVPPDFLGYSKKGGINLDPNGARRLYRENAQSLSSMKLTLLVPSFDENSEENLEAAQFIKKSVEGVLHLPVVLEPVNEATKWSLLARSSQFSMILHDWKADFPDPDNYYTLYSSRSKHVIQWSNPEYDALLDVARREKDTRKRGLLYQKIDDKLVKENAVVIPLYYASEGVLVGSRVRNFHFDPFSFQFLADVSVP